MCSVVYSCSWRGGWISSSSCFKWRWLKTGNPHLSSCDSGYVSHVLGILLNEKDSVVDLMEFIHEANPHLMEGDWRKILTRLVPGDSVLIKVCADSAQAIPQDWLYHQKNGWLKYILVVKSCEAPEIYYASQEEEKEKKRFFAYKEFDSLVHIKNHEVYLVGRGAAVNVIQQGRGRKIKFGDKVYFQLVLKNLAGKKLYESMPGGDSLELYDGSFILGLHEALNALRYGDSAEIFLPFFLAFGEDGSAPHINPFENVKMELRIKKSKP